VRLQQKVFRNNDLCHGARFFLFLIVFVAGSGTLGYVFRQLLDAAAESQRQAQLTADDAESASPAQRAFNLRSVRAVNTFTVNRSVDGELREIDYKIDTDRVLKIVTSDKGFEAAAQQIPSKVEVAATGLSEDSLFHAAEQAGEATWCRLRIPMVTKRCICTFPGCSCALANAWKSDHWARRPRRVVDRAASGLPNYAARPVQKLREAGLAAIQSVQQGRSAAIFRSTRQMAAAAQESWVDSSQRERGTVAIANK